MIFDKLVQFKKASHILNLLKASGGEGRFVGGCVRNSLMDVAIEDVDIATTLLPSEVERVFQSAGYKTLDVGKAFGTIIVIADNYPYEITTLRKDVETDGRRAVVEYTNKWEEDALRRDFTINAMSYCPSTKKLYDYFSGEEDLKHGRIKFVGDPRTRVQEDFLRILRFFRFYTYFGKRSNIDKNSLEACIEYANKIKNLSGERKYKEFYKTLLHQDRLDTLELMLKHNILANLFEHNMNSDVLTVLERVEVVAKLHGYILSPVFLIFVIANFSNIEVRKLVTVFKMSAKEAKYLQCLNTISGYELHFINDSIYKFVYKHDQMLLDAFLYMICLSPTQDSTKFAKVKAILDKGVPTFPIKGSDLIAKFQLKPGKIISELMNIAEDFWCQSGFSADRDQVLSYIESKHIPNLR